MPHPDPYESWKTRRAGLGPPADFADRVMAGLCRQHEKQRQDAARRPRLLPRLARLAVCSLACAACLFRILQLVAPFLVTRATL